VVDSNADKVTSHISSFIREFKNHIQKDMGGSGGLKKK